MSYVTVSEDKKGNRTYRLQISDSDGYNPQTVVKSAHPILSPSWSPDGTMIAYNGVRNSKSVIFRVLVDDPLGFETQVSPKGMQAESPVWSSDGSIVAYQAKRTGQKNWKIYYSLSSGSSAQRLTKSVRGVDETSPSWNSGLN